MSPSPGEACAVRTRRVVQWYGSHLTTSRGYSPGHARGLHSCTARFDGTPGPTPLRDREGLRPLPDFPRARPPPVVRTRPLLQASFIIGERLVFLVPQATLFVLVSRHLGREIFGQYTLILTWAV